MSDPTRSPRPRYEDFASRIGESFHAYPHAGESGMMCWTLSSCERLDASNGTDDGFTLVFLTEDSAQQDTFRLVSADGFEQSLFASPGGDDWVHATVN
ncbi:MAG: DUF6916 family protein [Verrucomicrobiales bacterium]